MISHPRTSASRHSGRYCSPRERLTKSNKGTDWQPGTHPELSPSNIRCGSILLQKSGARDRVVRPFVRSNGLTPPALRLFTQLRRYAMHRTCAGGGRATRVASRRRFCAMAARTNSSWAPRGPRSRSRLSFRMRFKCANLISIFLRACRDRSKASVPANDRATSRACSWMSRGILRDGSFGQHCGLSGHTSQSSLLARYRSVLPSPAPYVCAAQDNLRCVRLRSSRQEVWDLP